MKLKMKDMKIRKRLTMAFSMVLAIFIVVSVIIGSAMLYMINQYDYTLVHYAFPQGDIGRLMNATAEVRSATRGIVGYETDELINIAKEQHEEAKEQVALYMEEVRPTMVTGEGKACMEAIDAAWKAYEAKDEEIVALGGTTDAAASEKAQRMMHTDLAPLYTALDDAIVNLMDVNVAKGDSSWEKLRIIEFCIIAAFVITIVVAIIIAVRIVKLIAESIERPLKQTCERLATFAQGDLDSPFPEIDTKDEISEMIIEAREMSDRLRNIVIDASRLLGEMANGNFNIATEYEEQYVGSFRDLLMGMRNMNRQMNAALVEVDEASKQVSSGSTNMSEAAQALAEGATDQAASVEEIQATITDLTEGIQTTAEQLRAAYSEAQRCAQVAENSRTDMDALTQAMDRISETSQKIGNIISEIEDIASQTNLLSLNASIEAARAGEAGRGFAVVADQIRNLAEQSAQSAVDSRALIEGALHEIEEGNRVATNAANSLHEVVSSVESIAETSRDLSDISAEQARAMGQADAGVNRISEVVQSNSATAEESSATSEELTAQAICMSELVSKFTFRS